jgi:hypothetical protein
MSGCCSEKEEKLFGFPKWDVESLADSITRVNEKKEMEPDLYDAALKLLKKRQTSLASILGSAIGKRGKN